MTVVKSKLEERVIRLKGVTLRALPSKKEKAPGLAWKGTGRRETSKQ